MTRRLRLFAALAATAALGIAATVSLTACNRTPPDEPAAVEPAIPPDEPATTTVDAKPDTKSVSTFPLPDGKMVAAVPPKPLSETVKKGLTYLAETQQADGGWNQGGGWRTGDKGNGRVEGKDVADPSDVGNTAFALLAFLRAGHTATAGDYKSVVNKGLGFLCQKVDAADADSLYVTDVRNTQLQSKIGNYVDTFMATLVLTEFQGQVGARESGGGGAGQVARQDRQAPDGEGGVRREHRVGVQPVVGDREQGAQPGQAERGEGGRATAGASHHRATGSVGGRAGCATRTCAGGIDYRLVADKGEDGAYRITALIAGD